MGSPGSGAGELVGSADDAESQCGLVLGARCAVHLVGRRQLAAQHKEVRLDPAGGPEPFGRIEREGQVQGVVTLGVPVAELPSHHEGLGRPRR